MISSIKFLLFAILTISIYAENLQSIYSKLPKSRVKRVIGGGNIEEDSNYPFLVSIQGKKSGWWFVTTKKVYCGGSIIGNKWVLTAAHCFDNNMLSASRWKVRMASRKLQGGVSDRIGHVIGKIFDRKDWQEFVIKAKAVIRHPQYSPGSSSLWKNDIALIKLEKSVPAGGREFDQIKKIELPIQGDKAWPVDNQKCEMVGWGCTERGGSVSSFSKRVVLPKVNDYQCRTTWSIMANTRLCAGSNYRNKGICPGDSGGPLLCAKNNTVYQAGIASFTSANVPGQYPGVFTRVSMYRDWIEKTVKENGGWN